MLVTVLSLLDASLAGISILSDTKVGTTTTSSRGSGRRFGTAGRVRPCRGLWLRFCSLVGWILILVLEAIPSLFHTSYAIIAR